MISPDFSGLCSGVEDQFSPIQLHKSYRNAIWHCNFELMKTESLLYTILGLYSRRKEISETNASFKRLFHNLSLRTPGFNFTSLFGM